MSVYKDKNKGTWYVKYTIEDLPTGTKKRTTKRGFKTAKAAKELEHKAHTKVEPGTRIRRTDTNNIYASYSCC